MEKQTQKRLTSQDSPESSPDLVTKKGMIHTILIDEVKLSIAPFHAFDGDKSIGNLTMGRKE